MVELSTGKNEGWSWKTAEWYESDSENWHVETEGEGEGRGWGTWGDLVQPSFFRVGLRSSQGILSFNFPGSISSNSMYRSGSHPFCQHNPNGVFCDKNSELAWTTNKMGALNIKKLNVYRTSIFYKMLVVFCNSFGLGSEDRIGIDTKNYHPEQCQEHTAYSLRYTGTVPY